MQLCFLAGEGTIKLNANAVALSCPVTYGDQLFVLLLRT